MLQSPLWLHFWYFVYFGFFLRHKPESSLAPRSLPSIPPTHALHRSVLFKARVLRRPTTSKDKDPKYPSLSPTDLSEHWVAMENPRAGPDVTCQPSPWGSTGSLSPVTRLGILYGPRRLVLVAPVWALTHCQCWGASQGLSRARFTHGQGYAAARRTQRRRRPREILGRRKCGLGN